MRPTINMIAKIAGVSRGTVDRVINDRPYVNQEKKELVLKVMRDLRYTPNMAARALVKSRITQTIGVLYPGWSGYFEKELVSGFDAAWDAFKDFGVRLVRYRCESLQAEDFVAGIEDLLQQGAKGLALFAIDSIPVREKVDAVVASGLPVVTFNSDIADSGRLCFVGQDRILGGKIAAGLVSRARMPDTGVLIAVGNTEFNSHRDRMDGFLDHWRTLGRDAGKCEVVETRNDYNTTFGRIRAALTERPEMCGVYMANESTLACVEALKSLGLHGRLPVVAHDLSDSNRKLLADGGIDFVIDQDIFVQGYRPVELLAGILLHDKYPDEAFDYTKSIIYTAENL